MAEKKPGENNRRPAVTRKPAASKRTIPPAKPAVTLEQLTREIEERAHQLYEERLAAGRPGDDLTDWLTAETEVKKRHKLK